MVWPQQYQIFGLGLLPSALIAAIPVFTLLYLLGVKRTPAWVAAVSGWLSRSCWPWAPTRCPSARR